MVRQSMCSTMRLVAILAAVSAIAAAAAANGLGGEKSGVMRPSLAKAKGLKPLQRQLPRLLSQQQRNKKGTAIRRSQMRGGAAHVPDAEINPAQTGNVGKQNGFQRAYNAYSRALHERPLFTQIWSAFVVSAIGNLVAQAIAADAPIWAFHIDDVNFEDLFTYAAVGAFYFAPLTHLWFRKLAELVQHVPQLARSSEMTKAFAMLAVDQTIGAAAVNAGFLLLYGVIDRIKDMDLIMNEPPMVTILRRLKKQLWPLLLMNWCVWPAANLVNFYAVPYRFRVLYTNVVGALWSIYLASIVSSTKVTF